MESGREVGRVGDSPGASPCGHSSRGGEPGAVAEVGRRREFLSFGMAGEEPGGVIDRTARAKDFRGMAIIAATEFDEVLAARYLRSFGFDGLNIAPDEGGGGGSHRKGEGGFPLLSLHRIG